MSIFVHIKDIHFSYGRTPVLEGLSYTFKAGEMTAVLGHNGCGKSTLMKNIMGYLLPSSGVIDLASEGKSINSIGNSIRNRKELSRLVSFVPQRAGSFAASTVFDTVRMGRLPYLKNRWNGFTEEDRSKTVEVLRLLNLESFSERLLGCLSGGEQQKVLLARCLVQETPVIILDEATASMDIHHKVDIMETLKKRNKKKQSPKVFFLTHIAGNFYPKKII
ncbi:MAG: ABC transporter ATP-binding protein [Spirochaetales bacterium]|nr:ABC transporter ATP-binding protein [Spirochaetales bacterium]